MNVTVSRIGNGFIVTESECGFLERGGPEPHFCASVDETLKHLRKVLDRKPKPPQASEPPSALQPLADEIGLPVARVRKAMKKQIEDADDVAESEDWSEKPSLSAGLGSLSQRKRRR